MSGAYDRLFFNPNQSGQSRGRSSFMHSGVSVSTPTKFRPADRRALDGENQLFNVPL